MNIRSLVAALAAVFAAGAAPAATIVQFEIDPTRSFVTVGGAIFVDSFQPVRPGSSVASYQGTFSVESDGDQFTVEGGDPRTYPLPYSGELPPAYELVATTFDGAASLTLETISYTAASSFMTEPFSMAEGSFPGHLVRFFIQGGSLLFERPGAEPVFLDLHGRGAPNTTQRRGTISTADGIQTLTIPMDLAVRFSLEEENDTILTFSGEFVATRVVPEPNTGLIVLSATVAMLLLPWRRTRKI